LETRHFHSLKNGTLKVPGISTFNFGTWSLSWPRIFFLDFLKKSVCQKRGGIAHDLKQQFFAKNDLQKIAFSFGLISKMLLIWFEIIGSH